MDWRLKLGRGRSMASRALGGQGRSIAIAFPGPCVGRSCAKSRHPHLVARSADVGCAARKDFSFFSAALASLHVLLGGHMISLAGKAALVTGGSRGIGAATVKMFAQAGADVIFSYHRNREATKHVEQDARKHGTRIES